MSYYEETFLVSNSPQKSSIKIEYPPDFHVEGPSFSKEDYLDYIEELHPKEEPFQEEEYLDTDELIEEDHSPYTISKSSINRNVCSVKGCTRKKTDSGVSLFDIPKGTRKCPETFRKWLEATKWGQFEVDQDMRICNFHFEPKYFTYTFNNVRRLKEFAIPTINLPVMVDDTYILNTESCRKILPKKENKSRKQITLKNGTVLKQVFTSNIPKKIPPPTSFVKQMPSEAKRVIMKDGKVLTPIKLKPKKIREKEKDKSVVLLDDGIMVYRETGFDSMNSMNITDSMENSYTPVEESINLPVNDVDETINLHSEEENLNVLPLMVDNSMTFGSMNISMETFVPDCITEEVQVENEDNIIEEIKDIFTEEEENQNIIEELPPPIKQKAPKVLIKDGKVLKKVKFKRKPPPPPIQVINEPLPEIDQSSHTIEYVQEFPNYQISIDLSETVDQSLLMTEEHLQPDYDDQQVEEFVIMESSVAENEILEDGVRIDYETLEEKFSIPQNCSVPGCNSNEDESELISLKNTSRRYVQWVEAIQLKPPLPKFVNICLKHFKESDVLVNHEGQQRIHPLAVPSVNIPVDSRKRKHTEILTKNGVLLKPVKFKKPKKAFFMKENFV